MISSVLGTIPDETLLLLAGAFLIIAVILIAICVVCYIFEAIAVFTLARRRGIPKPWIAFIPLFSMYICGSLADKQCENENKPGKKFGSLMFILVCAYLAALIAANFLPVLIPGVLVIGIGLTVLYFVVLFMIYKSCTSDSAVLFIVLSIFFPIIIPFVLFSLRKKDVYIGGRRRARTERNETDPAASEEIDEDFGDNE